MMLPAGVIHLWTVRLDAPARAAGAAGVLSREELWRSYRFRHTRDRERYIAAHAALRNILAAYVGASPEALRFRRGEWGKPYLDLPHAPSFNLAHTGELALLAVARDGEVGVDVERVSPVPDCLDLARAYLSVRECEHLTALPDTERSLAFLRCWTRREAVVKATGLGLSIPIDRLDVPIAGEEVVVPVGIGGFGALWSVRSLTPLHGYIGAVARAGAVGSVQHLDWP